MLKPEKRAGLTKVRKLFHLDPEDVAFIKGVARRNRISESEVVRGALKHFQRQRGFELEYDPFTKLIGAVEAGTDDASRHDEALYE